MISYFWDYYLNTIYFILLGKESGSTLSDPGHERFASLRVVLNKNFLNGNEGRGQPFEDGDWFKDLSSGIPI